MSTKSDQLKQKVKDQLTNINDELDLGMVSTVIEAMTSVLAHMPKEHFTDKSLKFPLVENVDKFIEKLSKSTPLHAYLNKGDVWKIDNLVVEHEGTGPGSNVKSIKWTKHINKRSGIFFIKSVTLKLQNNNGWEFVPTISFYVEIGPVKAMIDGFGFCLRPGGSITPIDPTMIGMVVDTEVVKGSGSIMILDNEYRGQLQLSVMDMFEIFGFILLKIPGEETDYSVVVSLSAEFPTIQLGFGFGLNGVGGLVGIHRMIHVNNFSKAVMGNKLDYLLFPTGPIDDPVDFFNTIASIFPEKKDRYVFGPVGKLIWGGAVELVKFKLGIMVEVGGPLKIAIFGTANVELPSETCKLLVLKMDVLGLIDFGNKLLSFDASLYDSKVLHIKISGDMALRVSWGEKRMFVMAVGGFHPRFDPPPGIPKLKRLKASMKKGPVEISLKTYFAITSNTIQNGAELKIEADIGIASIKGLLGYDALIQFKPFYFEVDIHGEVTVKALGVTLLSIRLEMSFSGPNPFKARGKLKFKILWKTVKIRFSKTFGKKKQQVTSGLSPLKALHDELKENRRIECVSPDWISELINFAEDEPGQEELTERLDPTGSLIISQELVPIAHLMDKFAEVSISSENERKADFSISLSSESKPVESYFAPAKYNKVKNKLQAPSYKKLRSGYRFDIDFMTSEENENIFKMDVEFETILHESDEYLSIGIFKLAPELVQVHMASWQLAGSKTYFEPLRTSPAAEGKNVVSIKEKEFCVCDLDGNVVETPTDDIGQSSYLGSASAIEASERSDLFVKAMTGSEKNTGQFGSSSWDSGIAGSRDMDTRDDARGEIKKRSAAQRMKDGSAEYRKSTDAHGKKFVDKKTRSQKMQRKRGIAKKSVPRRRI